MSGKTDIVAMTMEFAVGWVPKHAQSAYSALIFCLYHPSKHTPVSDFTMH